MPDFTYSRQGIAGREQRLQRLFEILPGGFSWTIIIGLCVLSVVWPLIAAVIMIAFLLYWLLRLMYMNIFLVFSYARLKSEKDTVWTQRISAIDALQSGEPVFCDLNKVKGLMPRLSARIHCRQLSELKESKAAVPLSRDIYHLVIVPVIRETFDIVEPGIKAIKDGTYAAKRFLVIIALEETAPGRVQEDMRRIKEVYKGCFLDFLVTVHPAGRAGEARVKGANTTHAARHADAYFRKTGISPDNVIVSCFDADTVAHPDYFSCLTYYYMINPHRARSSYQPIPVYHNNIWDVPGFARILDIGSSFFQMIEATNPGELVTFSSHSMSFQALREIGYWPVDMISDDSAIFWKAFIHYAGDYRVVPIYTTVSMDIATGATLKKTFDAIYRQKRRWAWGVENFPIVMRAFLALNGISLGRKIRCGYKLLDSFLSWSTWSFLLLFGTWLPVFFASREFVSTTVYYTAPLISSVMFRLASVGLVMCMILSVLLLPAKKVRYGVFMRIRHVFEWFLIPFILLFLSAAPALDAQTRLMFGRYMEFKATDKFRKK
jgi:hypothetical protein